MVGGGTLEGRRPKSGTRSSCLDSIIIFVDVFLCQIFVENILSIFFARKHLFLFQNLKLDRNSMTSHDLANEQIVIVSAGV